MTQETMFEILCPERYRDKRVADRRSERTDGRRKDDTADRVIDTIRGEAQWIPVETREAMIAAIRGVMNES